MTCAMSDSSHECLKMINTVSAGDVQMWCFRAHVIVCDNSDQHDKKGGICRVSKLVNKS